MKLIIAFLVMILLTIPISSLKAEKVVVWEEFGRPGGIAIGNGYIYVQEKTTVFIYNFTDFKPLKSFGKEGEGPGEIKVNPFGGPLAVIPFNNKVFITSLGKLSIYSKTGEYIKEYKVNQNESYYPLEKDYLCMASAPKDDDEQGVVMALYLADQNLKKGKIIYKSDFEIGANIKFEFPIKPFFPGAEKNRVFVIAGIYGFAIDVFDEVGTKLYRIKKDSKPIKVPASYKKSTLNWFKNSPTYQQFWNFFKDRITFNDYYPPIYRMNTGDNRLYVFTSKMRDEERECIVMDHKGKEIKRLFLPLKENCGMDFYDIYTIEDNHFYSLMENEDEDNWELYRFKIE